MIKKYSFFALFLCFSVYSEICTEPDHYMAYPFNSSHKFSLNATLTDQFTNYEAIINRPILLLNPATKWHNGKEFLPNHKNLHYAGFSLDTATSNPPPSTSFKVINQFESFYIKPNLDFGLPSLLLVPSLKNACDNGECLKSSFFNEDHYLCYDFNQTCSLQDGAKFEDQFLKRNVQDLNLKRFCNPVKVNYNGKESVYLNTENNHLTCYEVSEKYIEKNLYLLNEFGIQSGFVVLNNEICVPTSKIGLCGNGIVDLDEECDDGNTSNGDACLNTCESATCGDGFIYEGVECIDTNPCPDDCLGPPPPPPIANL